MKPYERLKNETDKSWDAFVVYRDMEPGARTIAAASRIVGKSSRQLEVWAASYSWPERAKAWDCAKDDRRRATILKDVEQAQKRQLKLAAGLQSIGAVELQKILERARRETVRGVLKPDEIVKMITEGAKLERLNLDQPGEITEVRQEDFDYSKLTLDELRELRRLKQKLRS